MLIDYFIDWYQCIYYFNGGFKLVDIYYLSAIFGVCGTLGLFGYQFCFQKEQLILNKSQKKINQTQIKLLEAKAKKQEEEDYTTPLATPIITSFNTGEIEQNSKRTCMFYEFMALEPQAFGLPQSRVASNGSNRINTSSMIASTNIFRNRSNGNNNGLNSLFGVNEARAIGLGKGLYLQNNPALNVTVAVPGQVKAINTEIVANNNIIQSCSIYTNNAMASPSYTPPVSSNYAGYGQFFKDNWVGFTPSGFLSVAGTNSRTMFFYVTDISVDHFIESSTDNDGNYVLNNNGPVSTVQYSTSRKDRIYPQLGLNKITFTVSSGANQSGLAFKITDQSGTGLTDSRQTVNGGLTAGSGLNNGSCPDGCAGVNCFCGSQCNALLGAGAGLGDNLITLANKNTALNSQLATLKDPNSYLEKSIATATQPQIPGFSHSSMWDLRTISSIAGKETYPYEATTAEMSKYNTKTLMLIRNNSTNNIDSTDIGNAAISPANNNMAGLSASSAQKFDLKFDDGKPYTGKIISGKNVSQMGNNSGCTNSSGSTWSQVATANPQTVEYVKNNAIENGCIVGIELR